MPFPAATGLTNAYFSSGSGVPSTTFTSGPAVYTTEYAIYQDTATGLMYFWNRLTAAWVAFGAGGGGAGAMTKIASVGPIGASQATVSFSGIAGTYSALQVDWIARDTSANVADAITVQFNGDSTAIYDHEYTEATGTATSAPAQSIGGTSAASGTAVGGASPAGQFAGGRIVIPFYAGTTAHKDFTQQHNWRTGTASGALHSIVGSGWWRSTTAITSMVFTPGSGSFDIGTAFVLYGLS